MQSIIALDAAVYRDRYRGWGAGLLEAEPPKADAKNPSTGNGEGLFKGD